MKLTKQQQAELTRLGEELEEALAACCEEKHPLRGRRDSMADVARATANLEAFAKKTGIRTPVDWRQVRAEAARQQKAVGLIEGGLRVTARFLRNWV